ncbi:MAG: hypothetical protein H0V44_08300 [Planctomycetes bacterium]|nr:hypothetical protein [Planctomycetota bacterium]
MYPIALTIVALALCGAIITYRLTRASAGARVGARPRAIRIACAVTAAAMVVVMTVSTLRWSPGDVPEPMARVSATGADPTAPVPGEDGASSAVASGRILLRFAVMGNAGTARLLLDYRDYEVLWPRDQGRVIDVELGGRLRHGRGIGLHRRSEPVRCKMVLQELTVDGALVGSLEVVISRGLNGHQMAQSMRWSTTATGDIWTYTPEIPLGASDPSSVVPTRYDVPGMLVTAIAPIGSDDRLVEVPAERVMADLAPTEPSSSPIGKVSSTQSGAVVSVDAPAGALLIHIGFSSLVLIGIAALIAQLFVWRTVGFGAALTALVLYCVACERIVVGSQLRCAEDATATVVRRMDACALAQRSFFFQTTVQNRLAAVRALPQTPAVMRQVYATSPLGF